MKSIVLVLACAVLSVACSSATPAASPTTSAVPVSAAPTAAPPTSAAPSLSAASPTAVITPAPNETLELPDLIGEVPEEILLPIMQEVAGATGSALPDLTVVEARAVTWNDGSLGCPEPGLMYTQALVEGYWVVIEVGGNTYDFRVGTNGDARICPPGEGEPPPDLPD